MKDVVRGPWSVVREATVCLAGLALAAGAGAQTRVIDDFASVAGWKAAPSDGVTLAVASDAGPDGRAMRLDFDFHGHGGWAAVRRAVDLELPDNYEFTFRVHGKSPTENLEFKLVDASGENVWWSVQRDFAFDRSPWRTIRIKKRQVSFAWGPAAGDEIGRVATIELAITAGSGGNGSVWISDLALTRLPPDHPYTGTPIVSASSSLPGRSPVQALTGEGGGWHSDPAALGNQWISFDFGERRELGGLVIDWDADSPPFFQVETPTTGSAFDLKSGRPTSARSYVPLPETDTSSLRLAFPPGIARGVGVRRVAFEPPEFAATPNDFIASVAKDAPRGRYPRGFLSEQTSWTLTGSGTADHFGPVLPTSDGALELRPGFTVEPFVRLGDTLITWADVRSDQSLADGYLPIPTVTWRHSAFTLETTPAVVEATPGETLRVIVRYRLVNLSGGSISPRLILAARPFKATPPSQFLNRAGGVGEIPSVSAGSRLLYVGKFRLAPVPHADRSGAAWFGGGDVVVDLAAGRSPSERYVNDDYPSGALAWDLDLAPGATTERFLAVVGAGCGSEPDCLKAIAGGSAPEPDGASVFARALARVTARWHEELGRGDVRGPAEVEDLARAMKSNLAYILLSRDGPALRPGTRSYARSWIRDGAMMASALLRLGHAEEVRDYLRWYAPYQFADGKVPCVVDHRGADPVPENDSHGELLFLAGEYLRHTGDRAAVRAVWPRLASAVAYIDELRQKRRTDAYHAPEMAAFFGLLPESISHEGYSAKPMHSYWDDFWTLAGLDDAAWMAGTLGRAAEAARWAAVRDQFKADLLASIARVRAENGLAYVPGCVELGDFDPTSTTVALWPAGADSALPRGAVEATFERYWREAEARFTGKASWDAYTPYEWRSVGAFVRLGWRDRAVRLARWLMADRMPVAWNQWPEVVHRDTTKAAFLGDLPHAWVGSDFIRSFLDMLAYERPTDRSLVLGAGVPAEWLAGDGISVRELRTRYGPLSFSMRAGGDTVRVRLEAGLRVPPGGIVLRPPLGPGPHRGTVNGTSAEVSPAGEVVVRSLPADIEVAPRGPGVEP